MTDRDDNGIDWNASFSADRRKKFAESAILGIILWSAIGVCIWGAIALIVLP